MPDDHLQELRQKHSRFIYEKFQVEAIGDELELQFFYTLEPDIHFTTHLTFHHLLNHRYDLEVVKNWAFHIGMVEALSYWKTACSPEFIVKAGYLNSDQISFWRNVLQKGLSEFFFVNQIDGWAENFVQFQIESPPATLKKDTQTHQKVVVVPVGGGKDSVVSIELLKSFHQSIVTHSINETEQIQRLLETAQVSQHLQVTRQLDPALLQLNSQGYLNGHTPFSAMVSFVSTLAAYLFDYQAVALSNEFSANEGNTTFLGQQINHQYSKTLDYESLFRQYCQNYLSETIEYFSFLRPLHELQIAEVFADYPQYFSRFLSCNRGQKTGTWCGECPKCLFVYVMLAPFLSAADLESIFHRDLLSRTELLPILDELTGMVECKSLECVGTRQETLIALFLTIRKYQKSEGLVLPPLLSYAKDKILSVQPISLEQAKQFLQAFQTSHFVPAPLAQELQTVVNNHAQTLLTDI